MNEVRVFSKQRLAEILTAEFGFRSSFELFVAFSGGLDSTALIHALVQIENIRKDGVIALHANHRLHKDSDKWEADCKHRCEAWGIRFLSCPVDLLCPSKYGVEAAAREARYNWFSSQLPDNGILLTAHHLDDQTETILANLFRGTGVHGLKGITKKRNLGRGWVWRPLLEVERSALHGYVVSHQLKWIKDPANDDHRYTRNVIRHSILPLIKKTWPGANRTISRSADNWHDAALLLNELAECDLENCTHCERPPFFLLCVSPLRMLSAIRCRNVLHFWFKRCGFEPPSRKHLGLLYDTMLRKKPKATAVLGWPGVEIRRYRDWLYLSRPLVKVPVPHIAWDKTATVHGVLINGRRLNAIAVDGRGIKKEIYDGRAVSVRGRVGGERCWLPGHAKHHKLKKLLQQQGIPPWERDQIPLVYVDEELAAVVGYWYCQPFAAKPGESGMEFRLMDHGDPHKNQN